jgi:hypothetical protein
MFAMNIMKLGDLILSPLLLFGSEIWTRVAIQGIEQGLLSVAIDWSMRSIETNPRKLFVKTDGIWRSPRVVL